MYKINFELLKTTLNLCTFQSNQELIRLIIFPEAGFNADERVGKIIYPPYKTRCIVLGNYLAFYHILEDRKSIFISNIIHSKQAYIRLFKRKS